MNDRIDALRKKLPQGVDGVIIVSDQNRYYLTGMRSSAGTLLITQDAGYFIIDFRYIELAKRTIKNAQVILQDKLEDQLKELVTRHDLKNIAVDTTYMTVGQKARISGWLPEVSLLESGEVDGIIMSLRAQKDKAELGAIQAAQKLTDECFAYIAGHIHAGMTEREVAVEIQYYMMRQGAEKLAFNTICVSGVNSSLPHGVPSDKKIVAGDFVTMDFGASCGGYCSDMTRTVAVGHVTDEMRTVYDTVLAAQLKALKAVAVGAVCSEIDAAARDLIYAAGYEGCFGHGLGHGVGIDIHEEPRFSQLCHEKCRPGMVMTVEPGIYLEGKFGCRIEDMVYIGEESVLNLTHSPKELMIL